MDDALLRSVEEESKRQMKRDQYRRDEKDANALKKGLAQSKAQAQLPCPVASEFKGHFYGPTLLEALHAIGLAPMFGGTSSYMNRCVWHTACLHLGYSPMSNQPLMRFEDEQVAEVRERVIGYALANLATMVPEATHEFHRQQIQDWRIDGGMIEGELFWKSLARVAEIRIVVYSYDTTTEAHAWDTHLYHGSGPFHYEASVLHLHNHYTALCETTGILQHLYQGSALSQTGRKIYAK